MLKWTSFWLYQLLLVGFGFRDAVSPEDSSVKSLSEKVVEFLDRGHYKAKKFES